MQKRDLPAGPPASSLGTLTIGVGDRVSGRDSCRRLQSPPHLLPPTHVLCLSHSLWNAHPGHALQERRRRLFEKQAKEDELAHTMARELPPTGSQVPMLVDPTFEAVQRLDRYTIMQDQRLHPASFA